VRRRAFLQLGALAPLAFAGGCKLSIEQGLWSECRSGVEAVAREAVEEAWRGLRPERVWDVHAHVFGNGRSGGGIHVEPEFDRPKTIKGKVKLAFYRNGGCVGEDESRFDEMMYTRLATLVADLPPGARVMLMAFDFTHDLDGRRRDDRSAFAIPNEYARRMAARDPQRFEWIASVHPYREDAVAELDRVKAAGARAIKWLPPAMGIDLTSPRCVPFYQALKRLDLPLITHVGEEQAVAGVQDHEAGNPLRLRHALNEGVRVVAAHCATLGHGADFDRNMDPGKAPRVRNFDLFARLMAERRYEGLLFGDISAITQTNRAELLPAVLVHTREWSARLLNGTDYPLPGILPIFSPKGLVNDGLLDARVLPALRSLRETNALLFDFVLKRNLRFGGERIPASVFETRDFFENPKIGVRAGSEHALTPVF
jgi:mannonate dehydratase